MGRAARRRPTPRPPRRRAHTLQRIPLLIVDEVGYIPFDPQAANLMFMLVCRRYERASLIVTSNKPFSLGRDLRRRRHRRRDDRPARSPRRHPRPQRRQLPPQRPRPRPPTGRQKRRNGLIDHPRASLRTPQNAFTRLKIEREHPTNPGNGTLRPHRPEPSPASPARHHTQINTEWPTFQPARVAQLSTGLDSTRFARTSEHLHQRRDHARSGRDAGVHSGSELAPALLGAASVRQPLRARGTCQSDE